MSQPSAFGTDAQKFSMVAISSSWVMRPSPSTSSASKAGSSSFSGEVKSLTAFAVIRLTNVARSTESGVPRVCSLMRASIFSAVAADDLPSAAAAASSSSSASLPSPSASIQPKSSSSSASRFSSASTASRSPAMFELGVEAPAAEKSASPCSALTRSLYRTTGLNASVRIRRSSSSCSCSLLSRRASSARSFASASPALRT
mmetsp:Transcript_16171/g.40738  ORF Transcript_16171/g.40738 Transcript_16171/m.40738 type:complete len:202 (-) Transcript_16171:404-1009(-)